MQMVLPWAGVPADLTFGSRATCAAEIGLHGPHGPREARWAEASGDLAIVLAGTSAAIASIPTSANGLVLSAMHDQHWS
jgi:hypothetical protein